jgi:hypothetical protein
LTRREAEYLTERIRLSPSSSGSVLAEMVALGQGNSNVSFVWEHPQAAQLPVKLREMIDHAQNFSEIMQGAPLIYNLILAEQAQRDAAASEYRERIAAWTQLLADRSRVFREWRRERFWELAHTANPRIGGSTRQFIDTWWDLALAGDAAGFCDSPVARSLIQERERRLKKNLARIDNRRAQELWNGDSGSAQLDFRWRISQRLLGDIHAGLV